MLTQTICQNIIYFATFGVVFNKIEVKKLETLYLNDYLINGSKNWKIQTEHYLTDVRKFWYKSSSVSNVLLLK